MKIKQIFALTVFAVILFSCGKKENNKNNEDDEKGLFETVGEIKEMAEQVEEMQEVQESLSDFEKIQKKLETIKPIDNESLKKVIPEKVENLKRSRFSVGEGSGMNMQSAEASYKKEGEENKSITISITDGAGKASAYLIMTTYIKLQTDFETENNYKKSKSSKFKGYKCIETSKKSNDKINEVSVEFIKDDRFNINISAKGDDSSLKELEDFYDALDLSSLK